MSTARVFGRITAASLILILMAAVPVLLLAHNSQQVATGARFIGSLTADERLFEVVTAQVARYLPRDLAQDPATRDLAVARLDAAEWNTVLQTAAPPASLQRWTQAALERARLGARGRGNLLEEIVVPYGQMRDNIVNDPDHTVLRTVTEAQPPCAAGQELLASATALIPTCRPSAAGAEVFYASLAAAWRQDPDEVWRQLWPGGYQLDPSVTGRHADSLTLAELIRMQSSFDWRETQAGLRVAYWSWALARAILLIAIAGGTLVALVLISLLAARSSAEALRWVGGTLALVALATAALGLIVWSSGRAAPLFVGRAADLSLQMEALLRPAVRTFANSLGLAMAWQAGLMAVAGVSLWASSFLVRKPQPAVGTPVKVAGTQQL